MNRLEYYTHCGDCGRFLPKPKWIRKDNRNGYTKAICSGCTSNYDTLDY
jgi:hypothetical protein